MLLRISALMVMMPPGCTQARQGYCRQQLNNPRKLCDIWNMSVDLVLLRRFEAVHRLGSFSRAAAELGLTHSAITKSIAVLEESWNVRLFDRTTRRVATTEAGRRLALAVPDLLAQAEAVRADVLAGDRQLHIICGPAVIDTIIPAALVGFRASHPEVRVHVETLPPDLAVEQLVRRRCQLLLFHATTIAGLPRRQPLHVEPLVSEPYVIVHRPGHPVADGDHALATLLGFDWAVAGFDPTYQAGLPAERRQQLQRQGFPQYRLLNQAACIALALAADVLTLLPASAAAPFIAAGRFATLPFPGGARFAIAAVTLPMMAADPVVAGFLDAVRCPD
jgi:DNA-binding transcriptional LysR family regulator